MSDQDRLNEIEIMLVHQERNIEDLSDVMQRQQKEIDALKAKLRMAEGKIEELSLASDEGAPMADQKPPHY